MVLFEQWPKKNDGFVKFRRHAGCAVLVMDLKMNQCFHPIAPALKGAPHPLRRLLGPCGLGPDSGSDVRSVHIMFKGQGCIGQKEGPGWGIPIVTGKPQQVFEKTNQFNGAQRFEKRGETAPAITGLQRRPGFAGVKPNGPVRQKTAACERDR